MAFRFPNNFSDSDLGILVAVIIPVVGGLCWLYSAWQLGKLKWKPKGMANPKLVCLVILLGIILASALLAALR